MSTILILIVLLLLIVCYGCAVQGELVDPRSPVSMLFSALLALLIVIILFGPVQGLFAPLPTVAVLH